MSQSGPGQREVAYRLFAAEFDDSDLSYSESDEERAPNYVVTPTGARVNRLFAVGVLTEVEDVNPEMVRGRVVDPTGAFVTYAGQYQPDALAFLERAEPPLFLALSGKARTYEPDDGDRIFTSVRPESASEVDADTRDRWVLTAAERTLERIGIAASAIESGLSGERLESALLEAGVDDGLAEGVALALDHYGTTPAYLDALSELALDAVRVVAGERDEVGALELAPSEGGGDAGSLSTLDLSGETAGDTDLGGSGRQPSTEPETTAPETESTGSDPDGTTGADTSVEADGDTGTERISDAETVESAGVSGSSSRTAAEAGAPNTDPSGERGDDATIETAPVDDGHDAEDDPDPATDVDSPTDGDDPGQVTDTDAPTGGDVDLDPTSDEEGEEFDPGEFELDDEERKEIEEEYGTEFSTAGEVDPADTGIESDSDPEGDTDPDPTDPVDEGEAKPDPETEPDATGTDTPDPSSDSGAADSADAPDAPEDAEGPDDAGDVDLADAVMEAMKELDDGDGADREALIATLTEEHGVSADAIEESIQEALMSGRCYEPTDETLKPI